ncbi:hypothetical protein OSB04_018520, partial [Centaurea solstitialis]
MASSSSSSFHSTPPSSSSSQLLEYDVFLSFRGTDTRNTFIDHLYSALCHRAIHTYKDDVTLPRGETIDTALLTAIENSQIAVIVFSENYADSKWCLQELAHIMKCKDDRGLTVMPIFYHIDPSELQNQKGKYGEALAKHESENKKVELWRKALVDARKLSGYVANGSKPETIFINEIVDEISKRLPVVAISSDNEDLVGIADRLQALKSEMEKVSDHVVMVGIWGCGGAGKTTLASGLYDEISAKFEVCCFVENIREKSSISDGLQKLQSDILSHVSNQKPVNRVVDGRRLIKDGFFRKKVLIILDDVDHLDQLEALAGSPNWFGEGSRIIITTRDEHLLKAHKVNHIYNISLLDANEGMKLFRKRAPQDGRPLEEYERLSKEVVSYAGGLPLALKVLGSFLCDKEDMSVWRSALARLKEIPESGILEKLKISYDGLQPIEKELFLDIACFFRRYYDQDEAMMILDACGFYPIIGVNVLIQKALITVSKDGTFDMHDLIQEMGHHIVREENPNNPELHSRVWQEEDIIKICSVDAGKENDRIQALKVWDFLHNDSPPNLPQVVGNMKKLRSFDTYRYGETSLPTEFQPTNLCYLGLVNSRVKQLWEGNKVLPNLKMINLSSSFSLVKTPDFNGLPCLERLMLRGCERLKDIHPSIGYHERLIFLDMGGCASLELFPPIIRMKKLETLRLDGCFKHCKFPDIQTNMDNLVELSLRRSGIEVVSSSIGEYCTNLRSLNLSKCKYLQSIEGNFHRLKHLNVLHLHGCDRLNNIPAEGLFDVDCCLQLLSYFRNLHQGMLNLKLLLGFPSLLTRLDLRYCGLEDGDVSSVFCKELSNLQALNLIGNKFSQLHSSLLQLPRLKYLDLSYCDNLVRLPDLPSSISILIAEKCSSLVIKGDFPTNLKWLWNVFLSGKKCNVDHILQSMLQGNAIEDYYINIQLDGPYIPRRGLANEVFTLQLPGNWKIEFSGFLVYVNANKLRRRHQEVIMIEEVKGMENKGDILEDEEEEEEAKSMCYISFVSLKDTSWWKSIHTTISFSISECRLGVELVPKRNQGDDLTERPKDPTYISEFWDKQSPYSKTFDITNDSKSSIGIEWDFSNTYLELFESFNNISWVRLGGDGHVEAPHVSPSYCAQKHLPNLKVLHLDSSSNLVSTPDFNGLPCLERLMLNGCSGLKEIHPSIGCHEKLIFLDMEDCTRLKLFPPIFRMKKLETLLLTRCSKFCKFQEIQAIMNNLVEFSLRETGIEIVPSSIGQYCTNLLYLDLRYCYDLPSIEDNFHLLKHLKGLYLKGLFHVQLLSLSSTSFNNLLHSPISMEDYFVSIQFDGDYIPRRCGFARETFTLQLPWNWNNQFSGFLVYIDWWRDEVIIIKDVLCKKNEDDGLEVFNNTNNNKGSN